MKTKLFSFSRLAVGALSASCLISIGCDSQTYVNGEMQLPGGENISIIDDSGQTVALEPGVLTVGVETKGGFSSSTSFVIISGAKKYRFTMPQTAYASSKEFNATLKTTTGTIGAHGYHTSRLIRTEDKSAVQSCTYMGLCCKCGYRRKTFGNNEFGCGCGMHNNCDGHENIIQRVSDTQEEDHVDFFVPGSPDHVLAKFDGASTVETTSATVQVTSGCM